ncbi:phosphatidylinositol glycan anchor biosynthesis class U protein-like isoform X2 [Bolinopsis microptera]|uniref:phosphatidylinositol glycan anchor biosynthesis class U protein-like isoform X1 n=1 Tax=Bolinopsis microptera TaxID=2820187 RepID=UPI00307ACD58
MLGEFAVGVFLRLATSLTPLSHWLEERVEITTPTSSWKRIEEGIALKQFGLDPYAGDIVHEPPLNIMMYSLISSYSSYFFILVDILSALLLKISIDRIHKNMVDQEDNEECHSTFEKLKMKLNEKTGYYSLLIFLFNPYSIALCASKSTQCTTNLLYAVMLYGVSINSVVLVSVVTALASYSTLFPVMVLVPIFLHHRNKALTGIVTFVVSFSLLHYTSYLVCGGNWSYVQSVYGFILTVPDYTPNIGAAWYFFSEMFSHFTVLFLSVYQLNLLLYSLPLSLKFPNSPPLVIFSLLMVLALFKPYTCVGDYVVPFAMLPLWLHLFKYLQQFYVVAVATVVLTLLWPVLWYLWVHCLNANSNFYFAITLAFVLFQSFLLSDILYAKMRRDYALKNGIETKKIDGQDTVVTLN